MVPLAMRLPSPASAWLAEAIHRCQRETGVKLEVIAAVLGKSPTQLSRQVYGKEGFAFQDFLKLERDADTAAFGRALLREVGAVFGLVDWDATKAELLRIVADVEPKRMAKATLTEVAKKEVA